MIEHPVNLNEVLPFCCSFDRLIFKCFTLPVLPNEPCKGGKTITCNHFLDKWLKEFGQLQMRGSGDDLLIICQDSTKAGKKNTFTGGCKNFQQQALVRLMNQVDHKSKAKYSFGNNISKLEVTMLAK